MIRKDLKNEFGKDIKFSVRTSKFSGGCSIDVYFKKVNKKYCKTFEEYSDENDLEYYKEYDDYEYKILVNSWVEKCCFAVVKKEVIDKVKTIHSNYNYDESDSMIDYFDKGYYGSVNTSDRIEII